MKKKSEYIREKLGRADLFLDDIAEIARIADEAAAADFPTLKGELAKLECAGYEEILAVEIPKLEGRGAADLKVHAPGVLATFDKYENEVFVKDSPACRGAAVSIRSYLDKRCRPPWFQRSMAREIGVASAILVVLEMLTPLAILLHWRRVDAWIAWMGSWWRGFLTFLPVYWLLIWMLHRPASVIRLVPRTNHVTRVSRLRSDAMTVGIICAVVGSIVTGAVGHVWR